ncbi:hypothetical protein [Nostoc favosum]|uniref:hypothetical protein n=1 Tax=Nostoc favosum TaxID=2907819 RepID=UPI002795F969|nr:hypothetical protein [Nostoc favosum]
MATIYGTSGNDNLTGTQADDKIYGYGGNDHLVGGGGNDILTGGSGRDTFVLNYSGGGIDRITDFSVSNDILKVTTSTISSSQYVIGTPSSLSNYEVSEDSAISSTKSANRSLTVESSNSRSTSNIFTYNASTGALFYLNQQLAWLPTNLNWNLAVVVPSISTPPTTDESII